DRLAAHSIVEQQQRVGASCQASLGLPIPHQRDQVLSDACIKKAAANHAPNKNRFPPHPQAIFRLSGESRYTSAPLLTSWKCLRTARIIYLTRLRLTRFDTRIHMVPRPNHPPGFSAPCLPTGAATPPAGAGW